MRAPATATTLGDPGSAAGICRVRGWGPGTRLAGDEGYGETVIQITAVGSRSVLAEVLTHKGEPARRGESTWDLSFRDWREVTA